MERYEEVIAYGSEARTISSLKYYLNKVSVLDEETNKETYGLNLVLIEEFLRSGVIPKVNVKKVIPTKYVDIQILPDLECLILADKKMTPVLFICESGCIELKLISLNNNESSLGIYNEIKSGNLSDKKIDCYDILSESDGFINITVLDEPGIGMIVETTDGLCKIFTIDVVLEDGKLIPKAKYIKQNPSYTNDDLLKLTRKKSEEGTN